MLSGISRIIIFGAQKICHDICDICSSGSQSTDEDLQGQQEGVRPRTDVVRETRFPQSQQSRGAEAAKLSPTTSQPPPTRPLASVGATSRTPLLSTKLGFERSYATYSTVGSPNAANTCASRNTPYLPSERTAGTSLNYQVNGPYADGDVFVDVSNRIASTEAHDHPRVGPGHGRIGGGSSIERNKTVLKLHGFATSPRTARINRQIKDKRHNKQTTPRKSRDELKHLIDLEVAARDLESKFSIWDKDQVGYEKRKAASDLRNRCSAAESLSRKSFKEGRVDDGRQLASLRKALFYQSRDTNATAADEIYAHHNKPCLDSDGREKASTLCDVHGLYVSEARDFVKRFLETCIKNALRNVRIVTGKGNHSKDGEAKLKPAILKFLKTDITVENADPEKSNEGCILVRLKLT